MNPILAILTFRTFLTFATTAFALAVVMLALNIVTVHELAQILGIAGTPAETALSNVITNLQKVLGNILNIISQLLSKVFSWAGVEVDLNKIKIDVNQMPSTAGSATSISQ